MIIWGIRKKRFEENFTGGTGCPSCRRNEYQTEGILSYVHIFWIPLFVISKKLNARCLKCGTVSGRKELPRDEYKDMKSHLFSLSRVLPRNFGLIAAAVVVVLFLLLVLSVSGGS